MERIGTPSQVLRSALFGFIAGVAALSWIRLDSVVWVLVTVAIALFAVLIDAFIFQRHKSALLSAVCLFFFSLGWFSFALHEPMSDSIVFYDGEYRDVAGEVVRVQSGVTDQITVRSIQIDEQFYSDRALIFSQHIEAPRVGDRIVFACELADPEPFEGFRYDRYLAAKGVYKTCFVRELSIESTNTVSPLMVVDRARGFASEAIARTFSPPQSTLLAGLLLGEKTFSDEWEDRFARTGTSHIVAASGYNIALVVFLLFGFLTSVGVRRQRAFWVLILGIIFYIGIAGGEAAVVRAGVMGACLLVARQIGRRSTSTNVLLLTVAVMLAVNPFLLRDDIGFQLSVLATTGLLFFVPILEPRFSFLPKDFGIREGFVATLAATFFTLPVTISGFGTISFVAPLANLLVLPFLPYAMLFGSMAVGLSFLLDPLGVLFLAPGWLFLNVILWVIRFFSALPFAVIEVHGVVQFILAGIAWLFLFAVCVALQKHKFKK